MAKYWVGYTEKFKQSPVTCWVHKPIDSDGWISATKFEPSLPQKISGKGYPVYKIEYKGYELVFSTKWEIEHCISVLNKRVLPTTYKLAKESWMKGYQHIHWLTKWPSGISKYKDRLAIVKCTSSDLI